MKRIPLFLLLFFVTVQLNAQRSPVFAPGGKAIRGYDPVAFFNESKPVMGNDSLTVNWNDVTWKFSSEKNKEMFIAAPEKFAPQYGGYCAYGTSQGHKAPTQVETWSVVDGKLYFNYNKKVQESWNKDKESLIKKADSLWPEIKNKE